MLIEREAKGEMLSGLMAALVTPFDERGEIDTRATEAVVERRGLCAAYRNGGTPSGVIPVPRSQDNNGRMSLGVAPRPHSTIALNLKTCIFEIEVSLDAASRFVA